MFLLAVTKYSRYRLRLNASTFGSESSIYVPGVHSWHNFFLGRRLRRVGFSCVIEMIVIELTHDFHGSIEVDQDLFALDLIGAVKVINENFRKLCY